MKQRGHDKTLVMGAALEHFKVAKNRLERHLRGCRTDFLVNHRDAETQRIRGDSRENHLEVLSVSLCLCGWIASWQTVRHNLEML